MAAAPKLPPPRLHRIREVGGAYTVLPAGSTVWRIHTAAGVHALAWNELRRYGPIRRFRFDPQPPGPPALHPSEGVMYLAPDIATCVAEVFQDTRSIRPAAAQSLSGFETATELELLDLTGDWPLKVGAAHAINATGAMQTTRAWAVAFRTCFPNADGLWYLSSLTGRPAVALFSPAADRGVFPVAAAFSTQLDNPALRPWLLKAAVDIGYRVL